MPFDCWSLTVKPVNTEKRSKTELWRYTISRLRFTAFHFCFPGGVPAGFLWPTQGLEADLRRCFSLLTCAGSLFCYCFRLGEDIRLRDKIARSFAAHGFCVSGLRASSSSNGRFSRQIMLPTVLIFLSTAFQLVPYRLATSGYSHFVTS